LGTLANNIRQAVREDRYVFGAHADLRLRQRRIMGWQVMLMGLSGKKTRIERWIHAVPCVVRVEVDAIIPDADPSEPCLEPQTLRFLDDLQTKADRGLINELARFGDVYVRQSA
jgi:hypothetical protein